MMAVMFLDWFIQYLEIKESTNLRRLITGICGGYGIVTVQIMALNYLLCKIV